MIKFVKLKIDRINKQFKNITFIEDVFRLYQKYNRYLNDDFVKEKSLLDVVINTIERNTPFFWVILKDNKFAGFVFLENIIGSDKNIHSAEITTCFKKEYWGHFTGLAAKKFIKYCFKKLKLKKLKAIVYSENFRAFSILKSAGMSLEAELKAETMKNGKLQDVKIYSILNK
ncbi:GNAT family N-acetyltransferase [bacterium]|nr:GNAT family N-acetyltransferase [bacterium]